MRIITIKEVAIQRSAATAAVVDMRKTARVAVPSNASNRAPMANGPEDMSNGAMCSAKTCNINGVGMHAATSEKRSGTSGPGGMNASVIRNGMSGATNAVRDSTSAPADTKEWRIDANIAATPVKIVAIIGATRAKTGGRIAATSARTGYMTGARRVSGESTIADTSMSRIGIAGAFATTTAVIAVTSIASIAFRGES